MERKKFAFYLISHWTGIKKRLYLIVNDDKDGEVK